MPPTITFQSRSRERGFLLFLSLLSGVLLGLSFPPSPLYSLMYVALVPLLLLVDRLDRYTEIMRWSYPGLLVFHAIALYWVGGFTHGRDPYLMIAGGALVVGHPLFFWIPLLLMLSVRRTLGRVVSWLSFPFLWLGFEAFHAMGEFSFPWLTLANSQVYDLARLQIAEYTGSAGVSLVLLAFNTIAFVLVRDLSVGGAPRGRRVWMALAGLLVLYVGPWLYGISTLRASDDRQQGARVRVGVLQPNIDPWEKWGEGVESKWNSYDRQFLLLTSETIALQRSDLDLVVWPETAVPFYLLHPSATPYRQRLQEMVDLGIPVFTGMPHAVYFDSALAPVTARPTQQPGVRVDYYNAATLFLPRQEPAPVYKKMILVPFAERIPNAEVFSFLIEPLKWGVGISGWGKGSDTVVYTLPTRNGIAAHFSAMICYESIFPALVRQFVLRGAEFLVIITNDSWYGATSGPYQHAAFAALRAVETRRWIVRCANGGISGLFDPSGRVHQETELFRQTRFTGTIMPSKELTFYVRNGDLIGLFSIGASVVLVGAGAVTWLLKRKTTATGKTGS